MLGDGIKFQLYLSHEHPNGEVFWGSFFPSEGQYVFTYTGGPFENEKLPILGTSKHSPKNPRDRQFLVQGETIFLLVSPL